jgi:RNA polymerase sigma-70 factor, ECF subfamily
MVTHAPDQLAPMADVTRLLDDLAQGRPQASSELFPVVYEQLRNLATAYLSAERPDHTLQPTALVHEAYIKLVEPAADQPRTRAHFQALASQVMRNLLVDHARSHNAQKRGGQFQRVPLTNLDLSDAPTSADVLEVDQLLTRLGELNPSTARVVELKFFGGLTNEAIATATGCSLSSVERDWRFARAWLTDQLRKAKAGGASSQS